MVLVDWLSLEIIWKKLCGNTRGEVKSGIGDCLEKNHAEKCKARSKVALELSGKSHLMAADKPCPLLQPSLHSNAWFYSASSA